MAASLRKERRRKILENREARLRLILGEKENESEVFSEQTLERSTTSTLPSDNVECREDDSIHDAPFPSKIHENSRRRYLKKDSGDENNSEEVKEAVRGKHCTPSSSTVSSSWVNTTEDSSHRTFSDQTRSLQDRDNADCLFRVLLNIVFAIILVIYERQWRPKQLRSTDTTENGVVYQPSESFLWAFFALQMLFLCIPRYREISHSSSIAMISVVLQLSGVSSKLITTINIVLTCVLRMLSDFFMFVFGVVIAYAVMQYTEINKLS